MAWICLSNELSWLFSAYCSSCLSDLWNAHLEGISFVLAGVGSPEIERKVMVLSCSSEFQPRMKVKQILLVLMIFQHYLPHSNYPVLFFLSFEQEFQNLSQYFTSAMYEKWMPHFNFYMAFSDPEDLWMSQTTGHAMFLCIGFMGSL